LLYCFNKWRGKERKRDRHSPRSPRRDEESGLLFFPPLPAASSLYYVSGPALLPVIPISSLATSLSLSLSRSLLLILRLVLRSAREARVLPVPIVSCMINDRVDLSLNLAAYASFRALDGSIDREEGAAKLMENAGAYLAWLKKNLRRRGRIGDNVNYDEGSSQRRVISPN